MAEERGDAGVCFDERESPRRVALRDQAEATQNGTWVWDGAPMFDPEGPGDAEGGAGALIYDADDAVQFAQTETGIDPEVILDILSSRDRYHIGMGLLPDDEEMGPKGVELRRRHPDLFPPENIDVRYVGVELEREFIVRDTGVNSEVVRAVMEADDEFMRLLGIAVPAGAEGASVASEDVGSDKRNSARTIP